MLSLPIKAYKHKTDAMQRLQHLATHGYTRYQSGKLTEKKATALALKFDDRYNISHTRKQRWLVKKKGDANTHLVLWKQKKDVIYWWMLVTDGKGLVHDIEDQTLHSIIDKRLTITGYELVRLSFKNRPDQSWTFRMTKEYYQEWEEKIRKAVRWKNNRLVRQAHYSLSRTPGFGGARRQAYQLGKLLDAELKRAGNTSSWYKPLPKIFIGWLGKKKVAELLDLKH